MESAIKQKRDQERARIARDEELDRREREARANKLNNHVDKTRSGSRPADGTTA